MLSPTMLSTLLSLIFFIPELLPSLYLNIYHYCSYQLSWCHCYHPLIQPPPDSNAIMDTTITGADIGDISHWLSAQVITVIVHSPSFLPGLEGIQQSHMVTAACASETLVHPAKTTSVGGGDERFWECRTCRNGAHRISTAFERSEDGPIYLMGTSHHSHAGCFDIIPTQQEHTWIPMKYKLCFLSGSFQKVPRPFAKFECFSLKSLTGKLVLIHHPCFPWFPRWLENDRRGLIAFSVYYDIEHLLKFEGVQLKLGFLISLFMPAERFKHFDDNETNKHWPLPLPLVTLFQPYLHCPAGTQHSITIISMLLEAVCAEKWHAYMHNDCPGYKPIVSVISLKDTIHVSI